MKITIDQQIIDVPKGTTILKAAEMLGISIPTLCYMEESECHSSCMVCLVKDLGSGKMVPSCAMPVAEGMQVQTHSPEIREMRRQALELLLGDHVGDCEAPCRLSCPAFMNIPLMNRLIASGHFQEALDIVREEIALPLILGYICPAPCENACHRGTVDQPVSICMLKRFTAQDPQIRITHLMNGFTPNGHSAAVIGSGPAGLSASFYLRRMGYEVTLFEKLPLPGGSLRYDIPPDKLPPEALEAEIETLRLMGIVIRTDMEISKEIFENEIITNYKMVILATGDPTLHSPHPFSLTPFARGNFADPKTGATSRPTVFGCGNLIRVQQMAVRSVAQGKLAALEADLAFTSGKPKRIRYRFHSAISGLMPGEEQEYLQESHPGPRNEPGQGWLSGFSPEEAMLEAGRCLHCDCRKPATCRLRILSDEYQANRKRFQGPARKPLTRIIRHDLIIHEPEKCIKCGRCVEITSRYKEALGLTFIGRGFDVRIDVPLGGELRDGIVQSAFYCVEECPTGALSFKDQEEGVEYGKRFRMTRKGWEKL